MTTKEEALKILEDDVKQRIERAVTAIQKILDDEQLTQGVVIQVGQSTLPIHAVVSAPIGITLIPKK